ncbi:MAG: hypothetical protein MUC94_14850 [bacterium]|jgi:phenylacetate-CoA ligase|nr:hypothetical protein [bacterium]
MNPSLIQKVLFPAYRVLKGDKQFQYLKELNDNLLLPRDLMEPLQWQKIQNLLNHVHHHVSYYKKCFAAHGIHPQDIKDKNDFSKIPLLTKSDIRTNGDDMIAQNFNRNALISNSTGGSTGENLNFYNTREMKDYVSANTIRFQSWTGFRIGEREAKIWGAPFDVNNAKRIASRLKNYVMNKIILSSYDLSEASMTSYARILSKFKPNLITAYPTPLYEFSRFLEAHHIVSISPNSIICSAETLFPHQRELIEKVFSCKIYNRYGSREFGNIAQECHHHHGLHVADDRVYLEILNSDGKQAQPGEIGEVVVTDLDNYGMPFLRYKIGDLGVYATSECPCGIKLSMLERVEGRIYDLVTTPAGKKISGTYWSFLTRSVPGIKKFQVVQQQVDKITFKILGEEGFNSDVIPILKAKIQQHCGSDFKVEFQIVDEIPLTKSGKFRFVISNLAQ